LATDGLVLTTAHRYAPNRSEKENATQAEAATRGARMADEMGGIGDLAWLNPFQILHVHEAELLQIQHQQQWERLQTAYGLQHYEEFMVNNPGKSAYFYIDTILL
jgi:hypothetical protein